MTTAIQPQNIALTFGDRTDIKDLSARIKIMVPGGAKLTDPETMALAQVSLVCGLNPFLGEVWYIPGKGPMVGIRGARRYAQQQVEKEGGHGSYYWLDTQPCPPEDAGADPATVVAAFKSILYDSVSSTNYLSLFTKTVEQLRAAGSKDPVGDTKEMIGPKPCWIGYGFAAKDDQTRMNKTQVARKRAESDALKKRFDIPFGAEVSEFETSKDAEIVDGSAVTVKDGDDGLLDQLAGQDAGNPEPIDDRAWTKYLALCNRAEKVNVPHSIPARETTTLTDLRTAYKELETFVKDAEAQAAEGKDE